MRFLWALPVLWLGCESPSTLKDDSGDPVDEGCNGATALCDRPFNQVVFAGAHNAMSSVEREWLSPNHLVAVPNQLEHGIRGINLDVHDNEGEPYLCHGYCSLGSQPLVDGLAEIDFFFSAHPRNVVIITFESYLSAADTVASFEESGLADHVYGHEPGTPWPTLGAMIDAGHNVVVFTSDGGGEPAWYHDMWSWWFDNPYAAESVADFSCDVYRGSVEHDLYNLNHFITAPVAMADFAEEANEAEVLTEHINRCEEEVGRSPTQVLVDFATIGDVVEVVGDFNREG